NLRCDRDLFSLVLQDGEAQIRNREGSLVTPGSGSGGILVIVGEMLENLTNGLYRSCLYRSTSSRMNRDKFARLVVSFFAYPCPGTNLGPRNLCIQEVGEGRYPAVSSEDFLGSRLQELYANF
ncbi:MAG: hypothetical protein KDD62_11305, partial [Bdellovibrionales bacterium]|nr:hypothetical protein [Bdellovibrionales bacterium]